MAKKADFRPEERKSILNEMQNSSRHVSLAGTSGAVSVKKK
jgi:hypothetical protein